MNKTIILAFITIISCGGIDVPIEESTINTESSTTTSTTIQPTTTTLLVDTIPNKDFPRRGIIKTSYTEDIPDELFPGHKTSDNRNYENASYPYESDAVAFSINYLKLNEERLPCASVINNEIENIIKNEIESREETATYYTKEEAEADGLIYINYLNLTYNFLEIGEVYSVIYFFNSYSTGAAHPITYPITMTYDLKSCEKVDIEKIFNPGLNYIEVINTEIVKQLCAPKIPTESNCEYVSLFDSYNNSLKINGENIFNKGTTKFALSQYGLYIQFWEYDFYGASGSELILLPWIVLEDVLDKYGVYSSSFMKAYCVYDVYESTDYEPMWQWICED